MGHYGAPRERYGSLTRLIGDRYAGPSRLIRATGQEPFDTTSDGETVVEHPDVAEAFRYDDADITCRRWNRRQAKRTQVLLPPTAPEPT